MRKVLILLSLLPGLALADPVGGPATNQGIQTASPQTGVQNSAVLQPAPNASEQSLSAPTSPTNLLQGSIPSSSVNILIQGEGTPQTLSSGQINSNLATALLGAAALVILLGAWAVWQFTIRRPS